MLEKIGKKWFDWTWLCITRNCIVSFVMSKLVSIFTFFTCNLPINEIFVIVAKSRISDNKTLYVNYFIVQVHPLRMHCNEILSIFFISDKLQDTLPNGAKIVLRIFSWAEGENCNNHFKTNQSFLRSKCSDFRNYDLS